MRREILIAAAAALLAAGCGDRIEVRSSTSWQGAVGSSTWRTTGVSVPYWRKIEGTGNRTFDGYDCGWVAKNTVNGYLEIRVVRRGFLRPDGERQSTTAAYGFVQACGSGGGITRQRP